MYTKEIQNLKNGDDSTIRQTTIQEITEIFDKSDKGEIGHGDFIGEIRHILDRMELIYKDNWNE